MSHPIAPHRVQETLTACYRTGDTLRSRSVSGRVLSGVVDVPALPARLLADWEHEIASRLQLEAGDVEPLPLARARMRWPDLKHCLKAMNEWTRTLGLPPELLADCDIALMVCRGARYHHDAAQYAGAAFCNLFVSEDKGLDVHFPATGHRIPLVRGTVLMFDTGQPHAVVRRGASGFDAADFAAGSDCSQIFLTWELPVEHPDVAGALGIAFDTDPATASRLAEEQLRFNGEPAGVCAASGRWIRDESVP